jgi:hypothetical protein
VARKQELFLDILEGTNMSSACGCIALVKTASTRSVKLNWLAVYKYGDKRSSFSSQIRTNQDPPTLSIAPMMDYTNMHQRTLMRLITQRAVLYTEMVVCNTLLHRENKLRSLEADFVVEDPLVMQLGGSDPIAMRDATKIAMNFGYKEFNINIGCPSDKVSGAGAFGAVLMKTPRLVCDLALASAEALGKNVSTLVVDIYMLHYTCKVQG